MRRLEIAVTVALLFFTPHILFPAIGYEQIFVILLGVCALLAICQIVIEGYRWQMLPAHAAAIGLIAYEVVLRAWGEQDAFLIGGITILLIVAAIVLSTLMPVFRLPAPTGPYRVGTHTRHLRDENRKDPLSDRPGGHRELMIQLWYPADVSARDQFARYRERSITTFRSAHFALVKSHSILGARLAANPDRFPVLLYTPSWCGIRTESTAQVEELASHGYVVVGIDHPYSSNSVAFPDGSIARRKFRGEEDYSSEGSFNAFVKTADEQIGIRAEDARFVLDVLEGLDKADPQGLLTGRLDVARTGIFGCSLGGGTAAEVCSLDPRFKAGADIGGMIATGTAGRDSLAPFLFMFEGRYEEPPFIGGVNISTFSAARRREIAFSQSQFAAMKNLLANNGGCWITIRGIAHMNLFDMPFFSPLRHGRISPSDVLEIIRFCTVAFFDETLKGIEQSMPDRLAAAVPGVRFQAWPAETCRFGAALKGVGKGQASAPAGRKRIGA